MIEYFESVPPMPQCHATVRNGVATMRELNGTIHVQDEPWTGEGWRRQTILVTRHKGLVQYLKESGIILPHDKQFKHVTVDDIKGKRAVGILPLSIAVFAAEFVEVPLLELPLSMRGRELTYEEVKRYAGKPKTFKVIEVKKEVPTVSQ